MKHLLAIIFLSFCFQCGFAQDMVLKQAVSKKGTFFAYWGWNRGWFSTSDISFQGADYNFELSQVVAKDRQSPFSLDTYFNIEKFTIPQYNFRLGYFIAPKWNISLGNDHMKYVVQSNQAVRISGYIDLIDSDYNGSYSNDVISINEDFLLFEHTDGLNFIHAELRREDVLFEYKKMSIRHTEGVGFGGLWPRTNTTLLGKLRYDEFHWSGIGLSAMLGINVTFWNHFFVQTEFKGGYINMPDIRTTNSSVDKASQAFFFAQHNVVFGASWNFNRESKEGNR